MICQNQEQHTSCNQDFMSIIWYYFSLGQYALHTARVLVQVHVHRVRDDGQLLVLDEEVDVLEDVWVINAFVNH